MTATTAKTDKKLAAAAHAATAGVAALDALKKFMPDGADLKSGLVTLFSDKENMKALKEAGALAGVKITIPSDGMTVEQKKAEVIAYATELGLQDHPMLGHIKQVTRVTKGSSEVLYVLGDVTGSCGSISTKRTVPHKENGGAASDKLNKVCDIVKKQIFLTALNNAQDAVNANAAIADALK